MSKLLGLTCGGCGASELTGGKKGGGGERASRGGGGERRGSP